MGIYTPKISPRGKNDIKTAIQQFYTPKKTFIPPKQISGYAPAKDISLSTIIP